MSLSMVLYYKKIKLENLEWEYLLVERCGKCIFWGREREGERILSRSTLSNLPYSVSALRSFLEECARSQTAPRMIGELMVDNLVPQTEI